MSEPVHTLYIHTSYPICTTYFHDRPTILKLLENRLGFQESPQQQQQQLEADAGQHRKTAGGNICLEEGGVGTSAAAQRTRALRAKDILRKLDRYPFKAPSTKVRAAEPYRL